MNDFWINQPFRELLIIVAVSLILGLWGILRLCPRFGREIIRVYHHNRADSLFTYVVRFTSLYAFRLLIFGLNTLSLSSVILLLAVRSGYIPMNIGWIQWLYTLGVLWGGVISYRVIKNRIHRLWQYVFVSSKQQIAIAQDHLASEWLRAIASSFLFPILLIEQLPLSLLFSIWMGMLILWLFIRIRYFVSRLYTGTESLLYVFLYLCTQEILPLIYLGMGIGYVLSSEVFLAIYK